MEKPAFGEGEGKQQADDAERQDQQPGRQVEIASDGDERGEVRDCDRNQGGDGPAGARIQPAVGMGQEPNVFSIGMRHLGLPFG